MTGKQEKANGLVFSDILFRFNRLVFVALGSPADFEVRWEAAISGFMEWLKGLPAAISPTSRNLELLRHFEQEFHTSTLKQNDAITSLLLGGMAKPGETVIIRNQTWLVVGREVSINYSVDYTLINGKGEQLRQEYFD